MEEEEELEELEEEEELGEDEKEEEELSLSGHTGSREQLQILQFQIPNRENEYSVQTFPRNNINFKLDSIHGRIFPCVHRTHIRLGIS